MAGLTALADLFSLETSFAILLMKQDLGAYLCGEASPAGLLGLAGPTDACLVAGAGGPPNKSDACPLWPGSRQRPSAVLNCMQGVEDDRLSSTDFGRR